MTARGEDNLAAVRSQLDSYIETLQVLAGTADTRSDEQRARDVAVRTKMIDDFAHALAEHVRSAYGQPRWPEEEPEYAYGYNAGIHDGADLIDPRATLPTDGKGANV